MSLDVAYKGLPGPGPNALPADDKDALTVVDVDVGNVREPLEIASGRCKPP